MLRQPLKTQTVVASAARTASGNSGAVFLQDTDFDSLTVKFNVSAASGTSPTLDVYIQTTTDGGTNWIDAGRFAQITAAMTNPHYMTIPVTRTAVVSGAVGDATIAASTLGVSLMDKMIRVKWVIGGTSPSFTFSVDVLINHQDRP